MNEPMPNWHQHGGTAFPCAGHPGAMHIPGMSLLDWFAGQVVSSCLMAITDETTSPSVREINVAAVTAYRMAKALVAENERVQAVKGPQDE